MAQAVNLLMNQLLTVAMDNKTSMVLMALYQQPNVQKSVVIVVINLTPSVTVGLLHVNARLDLLEKSVRLISVQQATVENMGDALPNIWVELYQCRLNKLVFANLAGLVHCAIKTLALNRARAVAMESV